MFSIDEVASALHNREFFLEYLPTMSLADKRCTGAESLIRWRKGAEVVPPMAFIPGIENTPLSGPITYWVIDTIAQELRSWLLEQDNVHISINVPPEIFGRGGLAYASKNSRLEDVADKLILEVTERGILDSLGVAGINAANEKKMLIALDDMDIKNQNLYVLSRVPANIVKLDKSFVDEMLRPDWSSQKIASISSLIRNGDLCVIAEGVETAEQVKILMAAGVQEAQGWYFSPSLSASDFMTFYAAHQ